jgi:glutathione-regulated potassium-efflux system ancillary protein KefG
VVFGFITARGRRRQARRIVAETDPAPTAVESRAALILLAHPGLDRSTANAALLAAARQRPDVTVQDLYRAYPDFLIDVPAEQARLAAHPLIVLQFPVYWYSTPPLLKEWIDAVLLHGFAFGTGSSQLRGKRLMLAVTAGSPEADYGAQGPHRFTLAEFLRPLEATAHLCGMRWVPPFILYGSGGLDPAARAQAAAAYAARLAATIAETRP